MPRPRVLREPRVVPIVFEAELYRKLEAAAKARGLSVSAFIRMLVERELRSMQQPERVQVPADPLSPELINSKQTDDPPDPLAQLEVEEFEMELSKMESEVARLEEVVKAVAGKGHMVRTGFEPHVQELRNRVWSYIERWNRMKRWHYAMRRNLSRDKVAEHSRKLALLKRRLNGLLGLLGYGRTG
jgi:hypothetical protein